jgi:DNA-binding response OmpR family regulator
MRILIAEDEVDLARTLRKALVEEGYAVDCAARGDLALEKASAVSYDALVLRCGPAASARRSSSSPRATASATRSRASTSAPTTT